MSVVRFYAGVITAAKAIAAVVLDAVLSRNFRIAVVTAAIASITQVAINVVLCIMGKYGYKVNEIFK